MPNTSSLDHAVSVTALLGSGFEVEVAELSVPERVKSVRRITISEYEGAMLFNCRF